MTLAVFFRKNHVSLFNSPDDAKCWACWIWNGRTISPADISLFATIKGCHAVGSLKRIEQFVHMEFRYLSNYLFWSRGIFKRTRMENKNPGESSPGFIEKTGGIFAEP